MTIIPLGLRATVIWDSHEKVKQLSSNLSLAFQLVVIQHVVSTYVLDRVSTSALCKEQENANNYYKHAFFLHL